MSQLQSTFHCVELVEQSGLPSRARRALLVGNGLGPASRVLVVGGGSEDLMRCLDGLGLLVSGFEASPVELAALRRKSPMYDWRGGGSGETSFLPDHTFDLIIVRQHPSYEESLTGTESFRTTADFLAALRPGGTVAFLGAPKEHSATPPEAVLSQHLAAFPGLQHTEVYGDSPSRSRFLWNAHSTPAVWVAQLTIPSGKTVRSEWVRFAEAAVQNSTACCETNGRPAAKRNAA
mgnify:CR=1 FL=1